MFSTAAKAIARRVPQLRAVVDQRNRALQQCGELEAERDRLAAELARLRAEPASPRTAPDGGGAGVLDAYVAERPSKAASFRLFDGQWSSVVPGFGFGAIPLFEDRRILWLADQIGGFAGKRILELGPLEAGHTYMMARAGAAHVTAIEQNARAFLKCLIVQQALKFDADFYLGDFRPYVADCDARFDFLLASGVLYHMEDPVGLLEGMARIASGIGIWTHYYDAEAIAVNPAMVAKFAAEPRVVQRGACTIRMHEQRYLNALDWAGFCGGSAPTSYWLTRDSLLGWLDALGLQVVIGSDDTQHPNGPCLLLYAHRPG